MDIIKLIKVDNEELYNRLLNLSDPDPGEDTLSEIRIWCTDALSSEVAKEKVLYRRLKEVNSLSAEFSDQLEKTEEISRRVRSAIGELFERDLKDYSWSDWYSSTLSLFRDKNKTEDLLLYDLPDYLDKTEFGKLASQFERAREHESEFAEFQVRSSPRTRPIEGRP